jgi:hypothetical protein
MKHYFKRNKTIMMEQNGRIWGGGDIGSVEQNLNAPGTLLL